MVGQIITYQQLLLQELIYGKKKTFLHFGVPCVIVVNTSKISDEEKEQLLKWRTICIENLENLKTNGHPAWKTATVIGWDTSIWPQL